MEILNKYNLQKEKNLVQRLSEAKSLTGNPILITMYIPSNYYISSAINLLKSELSIATNIKNVLERTSVALAIKSSIDCLEPWNCYNAPKNGLVLCSGEIYYETASTLCRKPTQEVFVFVSQKKLSKRLYVRDNKFHLDSILEMCEEDEIL